MGGSRYERELVNALAANGFAPLRAPSSGSATERELPDILAGRATPALHVRSPRAEVWAIEAKSTSGTTAYADADEVADLQAFAEKFGARPLIAARFKSQAAGKRHYLVEPAFCRVTDGGNYGVPKSDAVWRATAIVDASDDTLVETQR